MESPLWILSVRQFANNKSADIEKRREKKVIFSPLERAASRSHYEDVTPLRPRRIVCPPSIDTSSMESSSSSSSNLRQTVMVNQFVLAAGCEREAALRCLGQHEWHFEAALSAYFSEVTVAPMAGGGPAPPSACPLLTPANTPATPPNFPDALTLLAGLSTADKLSPAVGMTVSPNNTASIDEDRYNRGEGIFRQPDTSAARHFNGRNTFGSPTPPSASLDVGQEEMPFPFGSPPNMASKPAQSSLSFQQNHCQANVQKEANYSSTNSSGCGVTMMDQ